MQIHCPQCYNPVELPGEGYSDEVTCSSCGATFRVEPGATADWNPRTAGQTLGKFELIEVVGAGTFGTVYKARDPELDRIVAIKVPRAGNLLDGKDLDRFLREACSVARLSHVGIVPVYAVGQKDGMPYLVSEFVHGITLADRLTARRLAPREAAELLAAVADALQYAHEHGVIHRDVKPANIMLDAEDRPRLMDFGLAKRDAEEIAVTLEGQVLGTPAYMSPEQAAGDSHIVDGRSDVYSLGIVLYQLLTGELPFRGNMRMIIHQVLNEEPAPPRKLNNHVPRDLEAICLKAVNKEPAQRYATARAMADDLRRFLRGEPITARRASVAGRSWRWLRRPDRVRDAGIAMILSAVLICAFAVLLTAGGVVLYLRHGNSRGNSMVIWLSLVGSLLFFFVPVSAVHLFVGLRTLARRLWAIWAGLLVVSCELTCVAGLSLESLVLWMGGGGGGALAFFVPGLSILFVAYLSALLAFYTNRNAMRWSQATGLVTVARKERS